jgi:hypothetical protein
MPKHPMEEDHDWEPFDFVLHRFLNGTPATRNLMLKLIPHIADGSWVIKQVRVLAASRQLLRHAARRLESLAGVMTGGSCRRSCAGGGSACVRACVRVPP